MIATQFRNLLLRKGSKYPLVQKASFWEWLINVHNHYSPIRIEEAGADRAAAEWLLRNGVSVKWRGRDYYVRDYNELAGGKEKKIQEITGEDCCISHVGFPYLKNLEYVEKIVIKRNPYLQDKALMMLGETEPLNRTLVHLEIVSCGNITDLGIKSLVNIKNLDSLVLADLPSVEKKDECMNVLKSTFKDCNIVWPDLGFSAVGKKRFFE